MKCLHTVSALGLPLVLGVGLVSDDPASLLEAGTDSFGGCSLFSEGGLWVFRIEHILTLFFLGQHLPIATGQQTLSQKQGSPPPSHPPPPRFCTQVRMGPRCPALPSSMMGFRDFFPTEIMSSARAMLQVENFSRDVSHISVYEESATEDVQSNGQSSNIRFIWGPC